MGKVNNDFNQRLRGRRITQLLARDGDKCPICQTVLNRKIIDNKDPMYITFDHIVPLSLGGLDLIQNIRLAHQKCNRQRGNNAL